VPGGGKKMAQKHQHVQMAPEKQEAFTCFYQIHAAATKMKQDKGFK